MRVNEIMSTNVKTVSSATPADDAWELMRGERIHHLVVMEGRAVAGVFSSRDAGGPRGASLRAGHTVAELMSEHVVTADADAPIKKVANLMRGHTIGSVVVIGGAVPLVLSPLRICWNCSAGARSSPTRCPNEHP